MSAVYDVVNQLAGRRARLRAGDPWCCPAGWAWRWGSGSQTVIADQPGRRRSERWRWTRFS